MVNTPEYERPIVGWVDTGSGPGMEIPMTREDLTAAQIMANARALWDSYLLDPDPDEQDPL